MTKKTKTKKIRNNLFYLTDTPSKDLESKKLIFIPIIILSVIWLMYMIVNMPFKTNMNEPQQLSNRLKDFGGLTANGNDLTNIYNVITSLFLHANIVHILSNTILFLIGWIVAKWYFKNLFIAIVYLLSGIISNLFFIFEARMNQEVDVVMVGASSSIYAIVAMASVYTVLLILSKVNYYKSLTFYKKLTVFLLMLSLIGLLADVTTNINVYTNIVHSIGLTIGTIVGIISYLIQKPYKYEVFVKRTPLKTK